MTLRLEGDSNDYLGKGLCGGKIIVYPPKEADLHPGGKHPRRKRALSTGPPAGKPTSAARPGERFCVRNSGVHAVVEGVGDHGCEYMTGGRVVVIGETGRNFAAGMSGGIAYVWNKNGDFEVRCNKEMVGLETLQDGDVKLVKEMLRMHQEYTGSAVAEHLLKHWDKLAGQFVKIMPTDYKKALEGQKEENGATTEVA